MARQDLGKKHRNARLNRNRKIRQLMELGELSQRQSRFLKAFAASRNKATAAIQAGYKGPPHQAGYQAFKTIQKKAPDVIAAMGISLESVIENYLLPQMNAMEMKLAQRRGKFTDSVQIPDWATQQKATRTMLELMNAFPKKDQEVSAQMGATTIVIDIPRPDYSNMSNVSPSKRSENPGMSVPQGVKD